MLLSLFFLFSLASLWTPSGTTTTFIFLAQGYADDETNFVRCANFTTTIKTDFDLIESLRIKEQCVASWRHNGRRWTLHDAAIMSLTAVFNGAIQWSDAKLNGDHANYFVIKNSLLHVLDAYIGEHGNDFDVRELRGRLHDDRACDFSVELWELFEKYIAQVPLKSFFPVLGIQDKDVKKSFGFPEDYSNDIYTSFTFRVPCTQRQHRSGEAAPFTLEVCSSMNPSRKFGTLAKVGPKGVVKHDQFEYYDVPTLALLTSEGLISVSNCLSYGEVKHCRQITTGCSLSSFEYCPSKIVQMADGTFILAMEATTFVATIHKYFSVWNGTHSTIHSVYESGQFMVELPINWHATIGRRTIFGNSTSMQIVPVLVDELLKIHSQYNYKLTPALIPPHIPQFVAPTPLPTTIAPVTKKMAPELLGVYDYWNILTTDIPTGFFLIVICILTVFAIIVIYKLVTFLVKVVKAMDSCLNCLTPDTRNQRSDEDRTGDNNSFLMGNV